LSICMRRKTLSFEDAVEQAKTGDLVLFLSAKRVDFWQPWSTFLYLAGLRDWRHYLNHVALVALPKTKVPNPHLLFLVNQFKSQRVEFSPMKEVLEVIGGTGETMFLRQSEVEHDRDAFWKMCKALQKDGDPYKAPSSAVFADDEPPTDMIGEDQASACKFICDAYNKIYPKCLPVKNKMRMGLKLTMLMKMRHLLGLHDDVDIKFEMGTVAVLPRDLSTVSSSYFTKELEKETAQVRWGAERILLSS